MFNSWALLEVGYHKSVMYLSRTTECFAHERLNVLRYVRIEIGSYETNKLNLRLRLKI